LQITLKIFTKSSSLLPFTGAHIAGHAGKTFSEKTGKLLPRITGFDPAKVRMSHA
jgi:hypothetical protein